MKIRTGPISREPIRSFLGFRRGSKIANTLNFHPLQKSNVAIRQPGQMIRAENLAPPYAPPIGRLIAAKIPEINRPFQGETSLSGNNTWTVFGYDFKVVWNIRIQP